MDRVSLFSSPLFLGFDHFERLVDTVSKVQNNYPPYNIEQIDPSHLQITIAVAGFSEDDLSIEVEDKQLVIRGHHSEDENAPARQYLYRGIASRQFQRSFVLADGIEVIDARLDNGLLHIDLEQNEPEVKVRQIKISKKKFKINLL